MLLSRSLRNSASLSDLRQGFSQFQQDLDKLQKFVELNATAFRKILKKWDKRSKSSTKEIYLSRQVEVQPCFNNEVLATMSDETSRHLNDLDQLVRQQGIESRDFQSQELEQILKEIFQRGSKQEIYNFLNQKPLILQEDPDLIPRIALKSMEKLSLSLVEWLQSQGLLKYDIVDDINERGLLHEAAKLDRLDLVELFVKHLSDCKVDIYGKTPLHYACVNGNHEITKLLLKYRLTVDYDGYTPLVYAVKYGHTECVSTLLESDPTLLVKNSRNPIAFACQCGNPNVLKLLLAVAIDSDLEPDSDGTGPLHIAAREGHTEIVEILATKLAIDSKDFNGWTPLFYAVKEGHVECAKTLIRLGARVDIEDESKWLPWTYALYNGHVQLAKLLAVSGYEFSQKSDLNIPKPVAPSELFSETTEILDLDQIPALELPPPIIPFRIYGHSYLDGRYLVKFDLTTQPLKLYDSNNLSSFKLIIKSAPESSLPCTVILPLKDKDSWSFQQSDPARFQFQFDVFPSFGSRMICRGALLASQIKSLVIKGANMQEFTVPLFDTSLNVIGELQLLVSVIRPFMYPGLSIGGKIDPYWKSTQTITKQNSEVSITHSLVTATSLSHEYIQVFVKVESGLVCLSQKVDKYPLLLKGTSLTTVFSSLSNSVGVLITIDPEIGSDDDVDSVLKVVYDFGISRNVLLASYSRNICERLNWKQPNYGVLMGLRVKESSMSIKEAISVAKSSNLLGLIVDAKPLIEMPLLIDQIKESGLLICSSGTENSDQKNIKLQTAWRIDGFIAENVFRYF